MTRTTVAATAALTLLLAAHSFAQQPPAPSATRPATRQAPVVNSPELLPDRRITFRLLAPKADDVRLNGGDIQGGGNRTFTKAASGVWELTLGPIDPGTYRYTFNVDGVPTIDPRNHATSESNQNAWSVVHVPGLGFADENDVPHGAVAAVHYRSKVLNKDRRLHVYTPPGYETGADKYPVFYLLHGSSDSDDSWLSVGRANFILDNLIASGKARPMIVVMPHGHVTRNVPPPAPAGSAATRPAVTGPATPTEFDREFLTDIRPLVESRYRVLTDPANRAIAGLSMGGGQSLSIALPNLQDFSYVGVFSSAIFQRDLAAWEKLNAPMLDSARKDNLKLLWFATGSADFLVDRSRATVDLLKRHNFNPVYKETPGGHTWINWRNYLNEFTPQLFR
jgi:enterochelin esterase-like enzyme